MNEEKDKAREIIKRISDAALELAFIRHDLTSDQVDVDDDADVKSRVAAHEEWLEDVKGDVLNCLTGDDTGCLDPDELDESNCELLWLQTALTTARREAREEGRLEGLREADGLSCMAGAIRERIKLLEAAKKGDTDGSTNR